MTYHLIASIVVFLIAYFFIATEKIDKTIAAILGAGAVVILHLAPYDELLAKIDINVIFLLVGMMIIVHIMAQTGMFEWLAIMIVRKAKGNGMAIILALLTITAFLSAFLDNVTTVILIAPITILVAQILELPAVPILIMEAIFSNIGGAGTLIGDPPNILIGSSTGLSFNAFLFNLGPVCAIITIVSLGVVALLMWKSSNVAAVAKARVAKAKPEKAILDPVMLKKSLIVFGLVMFGFFTGRLFDIQPGMVAVAGAFIMALVCRFPLVKAIEKVEWDTIIFFVGLFMLIGALEINGLFGCLGNMVLSLTHGNLMMTVMVVLWFSAITSMIVNNIPLIIALIPLINTMIPVFSQQLGLSPEAARVTVAEPLFWAMALGACLGGNGTLIGASANVVIGQIATRNKYKLGFLEFTKYGAPMTLLSLVICTAYMYFRYF